MVLGNDDASGRRLLPSEVQTLNVAKGKDDLVG